MICISWIIFNFEWKKKEKTFSILFLVEAFYFKTISVRNLFQSVTYLQKKNKKKNKKKKNKVQTNKETNKKAKKTPKNVKKKQKKKPNKIKQNKK